jgi:hypothetical protein
VCFLRAVYEFQPQLFVTLLLAVPGVVRLSASSVSQGGFLTS